MHVFLFKFFMFMPSEIQSVGVQSRPFYGITFGSCLSLGLQKILISKWLALLGFCFLRFFVRIFATSSKIGNVVRNLKNLKKLRWGIGGSIRTIIVAVIARKSKNFEFFLFTNQYTYESVNLVNFWIHLPNSRENGIRVRETLWLSQKCSGILSALGDYVSTSYKVQSSQALGCQISWQKHKVSQVEQKSISMHDSIHAMQRIISCHGLVSMNHGWYSMN